MATFKSPIPVSVFHILTAINLVFAFAFAWLGDPFCFVAFGTAALSEVGAEVITRLGNKNG